MRTMCVHGVVLNEHSVSLSKEEIQPCFVIYYVRVRNLEWVIKSKPNEKIDAFTFDSRL